MNTKLNNTVVAIQKFCTDICVHPFKYTIDENWTLTLLAVTSKDYAELERHLFLVSSLIQQDSLEHVQNALRSLERQLILYRLFAIELNGIQTCGETYYLCMK